MTANCSATFIEPEVYSLLFKIKRFLSFLVVLVSINPRVTKIETSDVRAIIANVQSIVVEFITRVAVV